MACKEEEKGARIETFKKATNNAMQQYVVLNALTSPNRICDGLFIFPIQHRILQKFLPPKNISTIVHFERIRATNFR